MWGAVVGHIERVDKERVYVFGEGGVVEEVRARRRDYKVRVDKEG